MAKGFTGLIDGFILENNIDEFVEYSTTFLSVDEQKQYPKVQETLEK